MGLTILRTFHETMSLKKTAASRPRGTANTSAAKETYREPTMMAKAPKTGGTAVGRQFWLARNSVRLDWDRKPRD